MRPGLYLTLTMAAGLIAGTARAAPPPDPSYSRDVISVATIARHTDYPSATCLVWTNAEGLGVGPAQLGGMHGLSFNINPRPLATEAGQKPTTFADGMAALKIAFPTAPAWMIATLEKHRPAIEAACMKDQPTPLIVYKLSKQDQAG